MKEKVALVASLGLFAFFTLTTSCQLPALFSGNSSNVTIALSLKDKSAQAKLLSGGTVKSINITVTAPDIQTISQTFSGSQSTISLSVPSGASRTFAVEVDYDSTNTFQTVWTDSVTADLTGGGTANLTLTPKWTGSPIVISDYNRLVQIDDMNGTNWTTSTYFTYAIGLDFDSSGNLYVSNPYGTSGIFRMTSIHDPAPTTIVSGSLISNFAIDRPNNVLYYLQSGQIYKVNLSAPPYSPVTFGTTSYVAGGYTFSLSPNGRTSAIAADSGQVYVIGTTTVNGVLRLQSNGTLGAFYLPGVSGQPIVHFQSGHLYVLASSWLPFNSINTGTAATSVGVILDPTTLSVVSSITNNYTTSDTATPTGAPWGAHDFAAFYGRRVIFKGQANVYDPSGGPGMAYNFYFAELISFDESLADTQSYGTYGTGTGAFTLTPYLC